MYVTLMHTLRAFFGADSLLRISLIVSLTLIIVALAAWVTAAFRESLERWRSGGGWRANLASLDTGLFKVLVLFVLARLLITAMHFQAQNFEQQFGRITEKNRSAWMHVFYLLMLLYICILFLRSWLSRDARR